MRGKQTLQDDGKWESHESESERNRTEYLVWGKDLEEDEKEYGKDSVNELLEEWLR